MKKRQQSNHYGSDEMRASLSGALNGALGRLRRASPGADTRAEADASRDLATARKDGAAPGSFGDPTKAFFPDQASAGRSSLSLDIMLEDSAAAIVQRNANLDDAANSLIAHIADRVSGEITLRAQGFRVLIGFLWFSLAAWLYIAALNAQAAGDAVLSGAVVEGMAVDDAFVLMRVFLIVAAAGLATAFGIAALANGFGRGDNRKVRAAGEALGLAVADDALEFDRMLTDLRGEMDRRAAAGDAVVDLSRAHMTALEACAYFRRLPFLTTEDGAQASRQFRDFLYRRPSGFTLSDVIGAFATGAVIGALYIWMTYVPSPEPTAPATPLAIMEYPWAAAALMLGGFVYAGAGLAFALMGDLVSGDARHKARAEALDALRSAFTAREAPRPADVVRRINDAVDIFKARVGGARVGGARSAAGAKGSGGANQAPAANAGFADEEAEIPAWRRRDSSVKFVETGFQASPAQWRADPGEDFSERSPDAKRGFFGLKNPFRD